MKTKTNVGWVAIVLAFFVLAAALTTGLVHINGKNIKSRLEIENHMQENLITAAESIGAMESNLSKLMVSGNTDESAELLFDTSFQARNALRSLNALPVDHQDRLKVEKFLNQISDFCIACVKNPSQGYTQTCEQLHQTAFELNKNMIDAALKLDGSYAVLKNLDKRLNVPLDLSAVTNNEQQTLRLIYDGPFSDSASKSFRAIDSLSEVNLEQAIETAQNCFSFLGLRSVDLLGEAPAPSAFVLDGAINDGRLCVNVSKNGGKIICATVYQNSTVSVSNVSQSEAMELATKYAKSCGYTSLSPIWYIESGTIATVSLAPITNAVVCYPDMVKIKLDLAGGDFLGIEAMGFCSCNHERANLTPKISQSQAQNSVNKKLSIGHVRLALIPHNNDEKLCYEFSATYNNLDYFVYIDALTGKQLQILRVVDSNQGKMVL